MPAKNITYKIDFFTYWHTGSGLSAGTATNATVLRNKQKLPYISGKTLKGLLREAAEKIHRFDETLVTKAFIVEVFGRRQDPDSNERWSKTSPCFFSNAELSQHLANTLAKDDQQPWLFDTIYSTAIEKNGIARAHSLRSMEVTVPLTLFAQIDDFPDTAGYVTQMEYCMKWVKRLGVNRNRGLGRCQWRILT